MDNGPDHEDDDVTRVDTPTVRPEPTGPATGQVRIVGAETAAEATSELPIVHREDAEPAGPAPAPTDAAPTDAAPTGWENDSRRDAGAFQQSSVRVTDEPVVPEDGATGVEPVRPGETATPGGLASSTELPHWTEPPTGEVPEVLLRETAGEETGIIPPSWREEDADWVAQEEEFEPSMFGGDHSTLGSLDETDQTDVERRPWEFDLGSQSGGATPGAGSAQPLDASEADATPGGPAATGGSSWGSVTDAAAAAGASSTHEPGQPGAAGADVESPGASLAGDEPPAPVVPDEDLFGERARPTGSPRPGRVRRSGLRPGRLRAKRPDDVDAYGEAPLAAEPPGASVTEVPGAGRRRGSLAGLAAADRSAERAGDALEDDESTPPEGDGETLVGTPAPISRTARRRTSRSPARAAGTVEPVPEPTGTGGGPPAPRRVARREHRAPSEPAGGLGVRVGTGLAVAVVALVAFKVGTVASLVLATVVLTFAAGECFGVLRGAGYHPATLLGLVGTVSLMVGAYTKGVEALPLVLALICVFTLLWYVFGIERGSPVAGTAATLLTVGWVSLLGSYAGLLLAPSIFPDRHGIAFLLGAVIATVANDIGALATGRWIGRRPLAPSISPQKTWEGLLGGAAVTVVVSALVVGNIHPWTMGRAALLGLVVAVVAPLGDLSESLLKRDLRLKDMGRLLPGHGGVLDRVDALLFVLPATYYLVRALNIG